MYYSHFGLAGPPFQFDPSAQMLYLSRSHREALAALQWGVMYEPSGFTLVIGETGTGKTTLVGWLLRNKPSYVRVACVSNPTLGFDGILREILREFGIPAAQGAVRLDLLDGFGEFLRGLPRGEQRAVVIVDEAQSLNDEALEELRLFSNRGYTEGRQFHIVLVGQPELLHRLMRPELRQFNDRIGARAILNPLSREEAFEYIKHRLGNCGASISDLFEPAAIQQIVAHSGGIPRRLNVLCHNAMLLAYSAGKRTVELQFAESAITEFENLFTSERPFDGAPAAAKRKGEWRRIKFGFAAAAVVGIVAIAAGEADHLLSRHEGAASGKATGVALNRAIAMEDAAAQKAGKLAGALSTIIIGSESSGSAFAATAKSNNGINGSSNHLTGAGNPKAESSDSGEVRREIQVHRGDTLRHIAEAYLGSEDALPQLIGANPQIHNTDLIFPRQRGELAQPTCVGVSNGGMRWPHRCYVLRLLLGRGGSGCGQR